MPRVISWGRRSSTSSLAELLAAVIVRLAGPPTPAELTSARRRQPPATEANGRRAITDRCAGWRLLTRDLWTDAGDKSARGAHRGLAARAAIIPTGSPFNGCCSPALRRRNARRDQCAAPKRCQGICTPAAAACGGGTAANCVAVCSLTFALSVRRRGWGRAGDRVSAQPSWRCGQRGDESSLLIAMRPGRTRPRHGRRRWMPHRRLIIASN
eukprot:scaffold175_cov414-Prasinococcus_capsulatus_cf.AAC.27